MTMRYDYLIVGGGMTAAAAAQGIREVDSKGTIGILSAENQRPYNRPPLTKNLWRGKSEDSIWRDLPMAHRDLILGCRVCSLDAQLKQVQDDAGRKYDYTRLLLATGGSPRRLAYAPEGTVYYRTLEDYHNVCGWVGKGARTGIIGGGLIGSEIAAALADIGEQVTLVFPENGIGARIYPADLSQFVTRYIQQKGVDVHPGMEIQAIDRQDNRFNLRSKDGRTVEVDHLIAGIGITPNIELAQAGGISIGDPEDGGGILVDEHLRTNQPEIYAAGDVASFYNPALQLHMRVEHEDNANSMGRVAGLNMAGQETVYQHQPFFYSDLFDLGFEAVGELNSSLETFADWQEPFRQGVVYYLKNREIRGVLLWNTWDQVEAARELIASRRTYTDSELKGRLPKG
jgi:3-phenylpropionate/trans-cinnamate dioxygenase ferredoxin reductase component